MTPAHAYLEVLKAVAEALRDLGSVPSGHLYASVCGFLTLDGYTHVINTLVDAGLVRRDGNHLLTWIGPQRKEN
jgi:hypothetical protein